MRNTYCSRKGGATIKGKFYPAPRTSAILAGQLERYANKMEHRQLKREAKQ